MVFKVPLLSAETSSFCAFTLYVGRLSPKSEIEEKFFQEKIENAEMIVEGIDCI